MRGPAFEPDAFAEALGVLSRPGRGGGVQAPAAPPVGGRCGSISTRSRGWGASSSSRPWLPDAGSVETARGESGPPALRAGDRGGCAGVGLAIRICSSTSRPASMRAASAAMGERVRSLLAVQGGRSRPSGAAPARSTPARTSRTRPTPRGNAPRRPRWGHCVAAGESAITGVAVVAERPRGLPHLGGCRQRLSEFGDASTAGVPRATTTTTTLEASSCQALSAARRSREPGRTWVGVVLGSGLGAVADAVDTKLCLT